MNKQTNKPPDNDTTKMKLQLDEFTLKFSELGMVVHDFNASTSEEEADCSQEFQGQPDILSKESYRTARVTQRNSCHKKQEKSLLAISHSQAYMYMHTVCVNMCVLCLCACVHLRYSPLSPPSSMLSWSTISKHLSCGHLHLFSFVIPWY